VRKLQEESGGRARFVGINFLWISISEKIRTNFSDNFYASSIGPISKPKQQHPRFKGIVKPKKVKITNFK
jgi:hypothetical protein